MHKREMGMSVDRMKDLWRLGMLSRLPVLLSMGRSSHVTQEQQALISFVIKEGTGNSREAGSLAQTMEGILEGAFSLLPSISS